MTGLPSHNQAVLVSKSHASATRVDGMAPGFMGLGFRAPGFMGLGFGQAVIEMQEGWRTEGCRGVWEKTDHSQRTEASPSHTCNSLYLQFSSHDPLISR